MKLKIGFVAVIFLVLFYSCNSCFDQRLKDQMQGFGCTQDCPGVIGCDGKTYCNECEANRQGIRVN